MYDYIIKNGNIISGDGSKPYKGDIALCNHKIAKIGDSIEEVASCIINAEGKYVTPGFIDIHRHADVSLFLDSFGELEVRQGLTTIVNGNCGLSVIPAPAEFRNEIFNFLRPVIGKIETKEEFCDFSSYKRAVERQKLPLNVGMNIGNGTIRAAVKGYDTGKLTKKELTKAKAYLRSSLEAGALGVSLGIVYAPEYNYELEDFVQVLEPMKDFHIPLVTHIRGEGDNILESLREVIEIAKRLSVPLHISHLKVIGYRNWGYKAKEALEIIDQARDTGLDVTCDLYPYRAGSTQLIQVLPPEYLEGGFPGIIKRLKDRTKRDELTQILKEPSDDFENLVSSIGWENIYPTTMRLERNLPYIGKSIEEIARLQKKDPYECVYDLLIDENCEISMVDYIASEEDIRLIMKYPYSSIISDTVYPTGGRAHPRMYGTNPRIIEKYVMKEHVLTLEEAIHKMTLLPAEVYGLKNKGIIKENMDGDVLIFHPKQIHTAATYEDPAHMATGFDYVFVNGVLTVEHDKYTGEKAGCFLYNK